MRINFKTSLVYKTMNITERFLNYTKFDTQSNEDSTSVPSTEKQLVFANYLKEELVREGLTDVEMDDKGYVYATLKGNTKKPVPTIGFISHYDTSPDCSGKDVKARIVENYQGGDIELSPGIVSSPIKFPELNSHIGEDLIVTDGHTLLGADDKAGIAEIMQAMCYLRDHDEIKHGDIRVGFNPDEEIGMGAHHFDVEKFGCQWAYTMDGGDLGELEFENFNAAGAKVFIKGVSVHTGYAKGKMINANRLACEFNSLIPETDIPETTEGYQGFYHLISMETRTEEAKMSYIVKLGNWFVPRMNSLRLPALAWRVLLVSVITACTLPALAWARKPPSSSTARKSFQACPASASVRCSTK